jgi:hypothetical protein
MALALGFVVVKRPARNEEGLSALLLLFEESLVFGGGE